MLVSIGSSVLTLRVNLGKTKHFVLAISARVTTVHGAPPSADVSTHQTGSTTKFMELSVWAAMVSSIVVQSRIIAESVKANV